MNVRLFGRYRRGGLENGSPRHSHVTAGTPDTAGHAGHPGDHAGGELVLGLRPAAAVGCSVNVGNRGSCISVATEASLAPLRGAKAMIPVMANPTPFMLVPLIIARRMIMRSRPNPD